MKKTQPAIKKNTLSSFFKNLGAMFTILPCEDTTFILTKKYFSHCEVSDQDEIYSDWKQAGDDIRFALNEYKPAIEEHLKHVKH